MAASSSGIVADEMSIYNPLHPWHHIILADLEVLIEQDRIRGEALAWGFQ